VNELQRYIMYQGLRISPSPPSYKPSYGESKGQARNIASTNFRTVRARVLTLEEALGINIGRKGQWGATLVGANKTRRK